MGLWSALNHGLNLVAPAAALALLLPLCARIVGLKTAEAPAWITQVAINFAVGCTALLLALWLLGHDGKMLGYGALVLACASSQWALLRGWRSA